MTKGSLQHDLLLESLCRDDWKCQRNDDTAKLYSYDDARFVERDADVDQSKRGNGMSSSSPIGGEMCNVKSHFSNYVFFYYSFYFRVNREYEAMKYVCVVIIINAPLVVTTRLVASLFMAASHIFKIFCKSFKTS